MLKIRYSSRFKRDYKAIVKRRYVILLLEEILNLLVQEKSLPQKCLEHPLTGDYAGHRECHVTTDWLLIYKIEKDIMTLSLTRTGTHSDLL
jgi:mRNA interferase YafQ